MCYSYTDIHQLVEINLMKSNVQIYRSIVHIILLATNLQHLHINSLQRKLLLLTVFFHQFDFTMNICSRFRYMYILINYNFNVLVITKIG